MRRPGILLSLLASLSMVLAPLGMLHAHIDGDHERIQVHGGHSHDLGLHDAHHAEHGSDGFAIEHGTAPDVDGDHDGHHIHHVVQLDSSVDDQVSQPSGKVGKFIAQPTVWPPHLSNPLTFRYRLLLRDIEVDVRRVHLNPPLRGPPATLPHAL